MLVCKVYFTFATCNIKDYQVMKRDYLFPSSFRLWGWVLLVPSLVLGLGYLYDFGPAFGGQGEVCTLGFALGLLLVGFARRRDEDECVAALRLRSLTLAVLLEYAALVAGTLAFYDLDYLEFAVYNQFTVLAAFVLVFHVQLWLLRLGRIQVSTRAWLLPAVWQAAGWALFMPCAIAGMYVLMSDYDATGHWLDEACVAGLAVALLLVSFSRERDEDEYTASLRAGAWEWAVYVWCALLAVGTMVLYDGAYLRFLFCNVFTLPVVFILRFRWRVCRVRKEAGHDE